MTSKFSSSTSAILFDLDGTLLNTFEGITRSVIYALEKMGVDSPPLPEDLGWLIGPPLESSFAKLMGTADVAVIDACMRHYRDRYEDKGLKEFQIYGGISEALKDLSESYALFLATAKPQEYGRIALENSGLIDYFSGVYGSEFSGARTEKDELIRYVLDQESLDPRVSVMVGDRKYDIEGARANGLTGVGVTWGFGSKEELVKAGAHLICYHPSSIISSVEPGARKTGTD